MKTDELKDKIYQAIGHAANADGIINQALATEYVMVNILTELSPTPSHSEETETKENTEKVTRYELRQRFESFGDGDPYPDTIESANGDYVMYSDYSQLQADNEAKEKRVKELEHMVKLYRNMVGNTGYSIERDYARQLYNDSAKLLTHQ